MLNKDGGRMENADEFLIISNCSPMKVENIITHRIYFWTPPFLKGITASWLLQFGLHWSLKAIQTTRAAVFECLQWFSNLDI